MVDNKIIFSMVRVGKVYPPNKQVLKDISLSFFYGAKIGVLGLNGSGKSSLLRIIAGLDRDILGEVTSNKGITFGYLPQEPELDPDRTVREIIEEGVAETVALVRSYEEVSNALGEPDADFDTLLERQASLQEADRASQCMGPGQSSGAGDGCSALSTRRHLHSGDLRR